MFYVKNRITNDSYCRSKYLREPFAENKHVPVMCRLNINKCHSCQTAGNSNFTLFQIVCFFQRLFSPGFHLNAWYIISCEVYSIARGSSSRATKHRGENIILLESVHTNFFSRSGVEINFSDVNIVTEVEHLLPREFSFFWQLWQKSNESFHFFWLLWQKSNCVVKATTNSIKFIERWQLICHHFFILKIWRSHKCGTKSYFFYHL
jgi:hypothetical protein